MSEADRLSPSERTSHWALLIAGPSVVAALWLLSLATGHTCPWRLASGLSCPLCGGTRATIALSAGRWSEALGLNLVAPVAVALALLHGGVWGFEALRGYRLIADRFWGRAWCWIAAGFVAAWIVKLIALAWLDLPDPALAGSNRPPLISQVLDSTLLEAKNALALQAWDVTGSGPCPAAWV